MSKVACFQIMSNGKVKAILKKDYLKRLGRKGYTVGYTDGDWVLFSRNWQIITLTKEKLNQIFCLPMGEELP